MNLPFTLDIGIGLFSIYLTLSLFASEFQELLTTLFQWRAQHLKQSIETLLAGVSKPKLGDPSKEAQAIQAQINCSKALANRLYNHPLIRALDHESKGLLGRMTERISQWTRASKTFAGKASGPSYLPSDTFSTTLLEILKIEDLIQMLSKQKLTQAVESRLIQPVLELIEDLKHDESNELSLKRESQRFQTEINGILQDFDGQQTIPASLPKQISDSIKRFFTAVEALLPQNDSFKQKFLNRLGEIEQQIPSLYEDVKPNIVEVIAALNNMARVAQLLQQTAGDDQTIVNQMPDVEQQQRSQTGYDLLQIMQQIVKNSNQEQDDFGVMLTQLPSNLCDSLALLAKQAQAKTKTPEQGINQLGQEIALWFDRSMDRSAGVYKRNAKGVAILIGLVIAVTTNTDTLHIINRLAQDSALRSAYSQAASTFISANPNAIACLQAQTDPVAQGNCLSNGATTLRAAIDHTTALPIGWNALNWQEQWQVHSPNLLLGGLKLLTGWLVSAIALSMGAPFWFNLLNKVVNVRNSGKPPASTSQTGT